MIEIITMCKPALYYLIIAIIVLCIKTIIRTRYRPLNIIAIANQFVSIILCSIIIIGVYNLSEKISWTICIIFITSMIIESIITIKHLLDKKQGNRVTL